MNIKTYFPRHFDTSGLVSYHPLDGYFSSGAIVFDESLGGFEGTATNSPVPNWPGFDFTSASSMFIDIGAGPSSVKTVALWVKPNAINVTDEPIDLNGTDFLTIVNGSLTKNGFAGGTAVLYTNGVAAATTVIADWTMIGITDTSAKNASDFDIGRKDAGHHDGLIGDVMLFSTLLTATEMDDLFELTKWRYQR